MERYHPNRPGGCLHTSLLFPFLSGVLHSCCYFEQDRSLKLLIRRTVFIVEKESMVGGNSFRSKILGLKKHIQFNKVSNAHQHCIYLKKTEFNRIFSSHYSTLQCHMILERLFLFFVVIKANCLCDRSFLSLLLPFYKAIAMGSYKMCILNAV